MYTANRTINNDSQMYNSCDNVVFEKCCKIKIYILIIIILIISSMLIRKTLRTEFKLSRDLEIKHINKTIITTADNIKEVRALIDATLEKIKQQTLTSTNPTNENFSSIVWFEYLTENKTRVAIPCIGVHIGNQQIISTVSCFKPYQDKRLYANLGFEADNDTEALLLPNFMKHIDYIRHNRLDADVKRFDLIDNIPNDSLQLETKTEHPLNFYTTDPYQLYRISVDTNYKPNKVKVFNDQIGDCGQLIYCLKLENSESIGSILVAEQNNSYLLLGIQQNQSNAIGCVPYTKLPLYVGWIKNKNFL